MKVSGFTIIRNGENFDYPYKESIRSLLPLVDEMIVNVGIGEDATLEEVRKLESQHPDTEFKIFESHWPLEDEEKRKGGLILSEQTNMALDLCEGDWCFYIQGDEVLHEIDTPSIRGALERYKDNKSVEGLLFDYVHLYGSYDVEHFSRSAYRREVRVIKNIPGLRSVGDAQSFKKNDGSKPRVAHCGGRIFHYGWVRTPEAMKTKTTFMDSLYHGEKEGATGDNYLYKKFWGLRRFEQTHPKIMQERIRQKGWSWNIQESPLVFGKKDITKIPLDLIERVTGKRFFEYQSYELLDAAQNTPEPIRASIILATYEMPRELDLVLTGLSRQSTTAFEILICDDGSSQKTKSVVDRHIKSSPVSITHFWQENQGFRKSKILNEAIKEARGECLIFLDGDCVPHRHFVRDHIEAQEPGRYLAGRRVDLGRSFSEKLSPKSIASGVLDSLNPALLVSCLKGDSQYFQRSFRIGNQGLRKFLGMDHVDDLKGCNYSVSKEDMLKINGYDEAYQGYGREDTDVEIRLQNLGLKIKSLKGIAIQFHLWHPRREFTPTNDDRLEILKKEKRTQPEIGIQSSRESHPSGPLQST